MATVLLSLRSSALQRATATLLACNMKCCTLIDSSGKLSNKQYRVLRAETHRKNRRDPDLERKARLEQCMCVEVYHKGSMDCIGTHPLLTM